MNPNIDLGRSFEKFKMEVLNVYITSKKFIVNTYDGVFEIKRNEFDEWVTDEQKREWIEVTPDYDGEPKETSGTMSWRQYYGSKDFYKDVAEYILLNNLKPL